MKKGGSAAQSQKQGTGGSSTVTHSATHSDKPISKAEITATIEKTVSDALARQMSDFQTEVTKSTKQPLQDLSVKLQELGDKSLDANAKNQKRFDEVEDTLRDLRQRSVLLEKLVKEELSGILEEKVQLMLHKIHPESEDEKEKGRWSEQLASNDAAHQQEIQKLHQQHHQDMLSVINDCCRKLKSSFTRQQKPYEVDEIHAVIDDIEQKMIREILLEIEKTDTHEDLRSFEEALVTSKLSGEVSQGRGDFTRLTSDEITASLNAFESDNLDGFAEELENAAAAVEEERRPVVEENISSSRSMITGDRGNIHYMDELKRTVDDIIALEEKTGAKPNEVGSAPDLSPESKEEVEKSLESLIISGDADSRPFEEELEGLISKDLEEKKKKAVAEDAKLGGQGKTSEILAETTGYDPDRLKFLEAAIEDDFSWADIQPPSKSDQDQSKSSEVVINPITTTHSTSTTDQKDLNKPKSLESKLESDTSAPAIPPRDPEKLKSLEGKLQPDLSAKSAHDKVKSHEVTTTPSTSTKDQDLAKSSRDPEKLKSLEGKQQPDPSAKSAHDKVKSHEVTTTPSTSTKDQDLAKSSTDPEKLKSLEGKLQPDPSAKSAHDKVKSHEVTTTPSTLTKDQDLAKSSTDPGKLKSLEGKLQPDPSAISAHDKVKSHEVTTTPSTSIKDQDLAKSSRDPEKLKSLEGKLQPDPSVSHGHTEPTKASLSEQVTASASKATETTNVAPRTGENPHHVEEVIHAAVSAAKGKP